jgi:hypothetical protein
MKILFRILGVITLIATLGLTGLSVVRSSDDAKEAGESKEIIAGMKSQIDELKKMSAQLTGESKISNDASIKEAEGLMNAILPASTYQMLANIYIVMILVAIIAGIFLFLVKKKGSMIVFALAIILAIAAISMSPSFDLGSKLSSRGVAYMASIPVVLTALFAFLIGRIGPKVIVPQR